jgi:hypothetical protein
MSSNINSIGASFNLLLALTRGLLTARDFGVAIVRGFTAPFVGADLIGFVFDFTADFADFLAVGFELLARLVVDIGHVLSLRGLVVTGSTHAG